MHAVMHIIARQVASEATTSAARARIQIDRPRPCEQPVQVLIQEQQSIVAQPHSFPTPIAGDDPPSNIDTTAASRGTNRPFTRAFTVALRGSSMRS